MMLVRWEQTYAVVHEPPLLRAEQPRAKLWSCRWGISEDQTPKLTISPSAELPHRHEERDTHIRDLDEWEAFLG
jgi:hypothetical protein